MSRTRKIFYIALALFFTLVLSNLFMTNAVDDVTTVHKDPEQIMRETKPAPVKKAAVTPKKKHKHRVRDPLEFGYRDRDRPVNGTQEDWENYYHRELRKQPLTGENLKTYQKARVSDEKVAKALAKYDKDIEEFKARIAADPGDNEAKSELQAAYRHRAYTKAVADRFKDLPPESE